MNYLIYLYNHDETAETQMSVIREEFFAAALHFAGRAGFNSLKDMEEVLPAGHDLAMRLPKVDIAEYLFEMKERWTDSSNAKQYARAITKTKKELA